MEKEKVVEREKTRRRRTASGDSRLNMETQRETERPIQTQTHIESEEAEHTVQVIEVAMNTTSPMSQQSSDVSESDEYGKSSDLDDDANESSDEYLDDDDDEKYAF